jgi:hypothetical protein
LNEIVVNEKRKVEKYKKRIQRLAEKDKKKLGMTSENELTPNSKTKIYMMILKTLVTKEERLYF